MAIHYPHELKALAKELGLTLGTIAVGKHYLWQGVLDVDGAHELLGRIREYTAAMDAIRKEMAEHVAANGPPPPPPPPAEPVEPTPQRRRREPAPVVPPPPPPQPRPAARRRRKAVA